MYRSKKEVDKHVSDILSKLQNENEKSLRGFPFAKLYFQVKDYEMAKRYLGIYLNVKETHAPGHKLMGQILEALGNPESALQSYKRSLDIEGNQKDLVLKVCELYCKIPVDPDTARYWADRAEKLFHHHDVIFQLRECIVNAEGEPNIKELEVLITTEMNSRPNDVNLYTKLLRLYTDTERLEEAYRLAAQVETKKPFPYNIDWYYCLADIFEAYQEECPHLELQFCLEYFLVLDHLCTILLAEPHALSPDNGTPTKHGRSVADAAAVLHTFDKLLQKANVQESLHQDPSWSYIKQQMQGQLYLHLGTLLLKRAKKERANWKEACRYASALFLVAYTFKPGSLQQEAWFCKMEANKQIFLAMRQKGFLRLSHAGHVLSSLCSAIEERPRWLQKVKQETCVPQAQEKIFQRAFSSIPSTRQQSANSANRQAQSFFLQDTSFLKASLEFPTDVSLLEYDKISHKVYPDSLHHLVWLSIHWLPVKNYKAQPKFQIFEKLQLSNALLSSGSPESLCQLDVDAFLCATIFSAWSALEVRSRIKTPSKGTTPHALLMYMTPDICDPLCTPEQASWWKAAHSLYFSNAKEKLGELRHTLRRGLETIRGIGLHGMEVTLVVHLARHFANQANTLRQSLGDGTPSEEVSVLEERATHYWTLVLSALEKQQGQIGSHLPMTPRSRNQAAQGNTVKQPPLFPSFHPEPSVQESLTLIEEAKFYLASRLLNTGHLTEAAQAFSRLTTAEAAHNQATVLVKLSQQAGIEGDARSGLLSQARDSLYLTLDRVAGDKRHPLNLQLHEEIEAVEMKLAHSERNGVHQGEGSEESGLEDEEDEYGSAAVNALTNNTPQQSVISNNYSLRELLNLGAPTTRNLNGSLFDPPNTGSTPRSRLRPSPERLDAQIRALSYNQVGVVQVLLDQQRTLMETNKAIVEELRQHKTLVEDLKKKLDDLENAKCNHPHHNQPRPRPAAQRSRSMRSSQQNDNEEYDENGHPDPGHLYDYALDAEENSFDYGSYLHDPRSASNMGYAMMMQYPPHYPPPPHMPPSITPTMPPQTLMNQPAPPRNCYQPYGSALTFSEGQQLPQFNFRMPPPSMNTLENRPSVFTRVGQNSGSIVPPPPPPPQQIWENQPLPPQQQQDMPWNNKSPANAPNAFQIPLPPSNMPSDQPPSILSSVTSPPVPPLFMTPQAPQAANSSMLKGMLTGRQPFTSFLPGIQKSPQEPFQGFLTPGNTSSISADAASTPSSAQKDPEDVDFDFKPAIPLPDEVDLFTGEEHETTLFEERAKLFRFSEKEWKERGVGTLKLLEDKSSGRIRLVMRRDQVLKICANHHIQADMKLQAMKDSDRAWIWAAQDFAEETLKNEKFCIRFKTKEISLAFKVVFEAAVQKETQSPRKTAVETPGIHTGADGDSKSVPDSTPKAFGEQFKPAAGSWACDTCLVNNKAGTTRCVACETPKAGAESKTNDSPPKTTGFTFGGLPVQGIEQFKPAAGSWACDTCMVNNKAGTTHCVACETPKAGAESKTNDSPPKTTGFTFGGPPVQGGGFSALFQSKSVKCTKCKFVSVPKDGDLCPGCKNAAIPAALPASTKPQTEGATTMFGGLSSAKCTKCSFVNVSKEGDLCSGCKNITILAASANIKPQTEGEKNVFGGFTFITPPVIKSSNEPEKRDKPATTTTTSNKLERPIATATNKQRETPPTKEKSNTTSPFAAFQFSLKPQTSDAKTNIFSTTPLTAKVIEPSRLFGETSTATDLTFVSLPGTVATGFKADPNFKGFPGSGKQLFATPEASSPNDSAKDNAEEFVPSAEFKPVIPLPELIETKTGEEDEEKLFAERAKLFRYVSETKEWKERGIGEVKILKNPKTNKSRVLMRRDQVLKICANHRISPQMALTPMPSSDRAWIWCAQDFSEGEMKEEQFAIKFKNRDIALKFKDVFGECQATVETAASEVSSAVTDTKSTTTTTRTSKTVKNAQSGLLLSDVFKPAVGSWECSGCFIRNAASVHICPACQTRKPGSEGSPKPTPSLSAQFKPQEGSWECKSCLLRNEAKTKSCPACKSPKPGYKPPAQKPSAAKSLSERFKPEIGSWNCSKCYVQNKETADSCIACLSPKVSDTASTTKDVLSNFSFITAVAAKNKAQAEGVKNPFALSSTTSASTPSPFLLPMGKQAEKTEIPTGSPVKTAGFKFTSQAESSPFGGFSFGNAPANNTSTPVSTLGSKATPPPSGFRFDKVSESQTTDSFPFGKATTNIASTPVTIPGNKTPPPGDPLEFKFGSPQKFEFCFSGVRPRSPSKAPKSPGTPTDAGKDGTEDESETSDAEIFFQPVIPLPPKVDVKTGEEGEEVLYCHRAKLFRLDQGEWKERGTGDMKLLRDPQTDKIRLLMRREQVLKVCLNHLLTLDLELQEKGDRTWFWWAVDYAEGAPHPEQLALRFKNHEVAESFKDAVENGKTYLRNQNSESSETYPVSPVREQPPSQEQSQKENSASDKPAEEKPATPIQETPRVTAESFSFVANQNASPKATFGLAARYGVSTSPGTSFVFGNAGNQQIFNSKPSSTSYVFGSSMVNEKTASPTAAASSDEVQVLEVKKTSSENQDRAESLQLPVNFYRYEDKDPCEGCRGCDDHDHSHGDHQEGLEVVFIKKATKEQVELAKRLLLPESFFLYENAPPCPGCRGCWEEDLLKLKPKTPSTALEPAKVEVTKTTKDAAPTPNWGQLSSPKAAVFSPAATVPTPTPAPETETAKLILTPNSFLTTSLSEGVPEFSFAKLAAQTEGNGFASLAAQNSNATAFKSSTGSPGGFAGAGTPLFASAMSSKDNAGEGREEVPPSLDVHFDPLVPLPELIEVKTGEEDETPLFSQRARLYRYSQDSKQWKERGTGEMKILKHKTKCQYRLVLRREQVLKIACNHLITSTLELNPMSDSNKSLVWSALDFSEGVQTAEMFCIKFKNRELLEEFKLKVEECQKALLEQENAEEAENVQGLSQHEEDSENEDDHDDYDEDEDEDEEPPEWVEDYHEGQSQEDLYYQATEKYEDMRREAQQEVPHPESDLSFVTGVASLNLQEEGQTENPEDLYHSEDVDDEDEEDDDDEQLMFEKRINLAVAPMGSKDYKPLGIGTLRMLYDDTVFGGRLQVADDQAQLLCDNIIAVQTCLRVVDKEATWAAADMTLPEGSRRQFKATFSSTAAAQEFQRTFDEAKQLAVTSEIVEHEGPTPNF